jgi:hypothetical protein
MKSNLGLGNSIAQNVSHGLGAVLNEAMLPLYFSCAWEMVLYSAFSAIWVILPTPSHNESGKHLRSTCQKHGIKQMFMSDRTTSAVMSFCSAPVESVCYGCSRRCQCPAAFSIGGKQGSTQNQRLADCCTMRRGSFMELCGRNRVDKLPGGSADLPLEPRLSRLP